MLLALVLLLRIASSFALHDPPRLRDSNDHEDSHDKNQVTEFDWNAIPAASHLNYTSCYDGFECARLEVPLDWTDASNLNKVQLAIIRLPATVSQDDPSFGGTVLFNPGGPGGSGIDVMRWTGNGIRSVIDGSKHFELLSWDPRGVRYTTPAMSCFKDDWQRDIWTYRSGVVGPMDASNASLIQKWALAKAFGKLCERQHSSIDSDGPIIAKFATTALVARDMVAIIDEVEQHRLNQLKARKSPAEQNALTFNGPALLNYWGYSYGSYLGNTFASMFPSRVGRVILDSVVDSDDYTETGWFSNLLDYHKNLEFFCKDCFDAGRKCPINQNHIKSPADIEAKILELLEQLKLDPVVALHDEAPDIVTSADLASLLLSTSYYPSWLWPELAQIIADLLQGNTTLMSRHLQTLRAPSTGTSSDELGRLLLEGRNETYPSPPAYPSESDAAHAILCGDGDDITHLEAEDWYRRLQIWHSESKVAGWKWSEISMLCAHWPKTFRPAERNRFRGPWRSELSQYDSRGSPLLLIGGSADPVLPLRNAYKAAAQHEGAHVLVQEGPGHCTGFLNPNPCTWEHIRAFFANGILPGNSTICKRDRNAWS